MRSQVIKVTVVVEESDGSARVEEIGPREIESLNFILHAANGPTDPVALLAGMIEHRRIDCAIQEAGREIPETPPDLIQGTD